jgi:DNA-binding MarR family transcriptional regulator
MQDPVPPPLDVNSPLVKLIGTARRQIRQSFWGRYATLGLTPQQGWILRVLSAQGPMSLHCLSQWVFMDDPTACRVVKTLQDKGLVDSVPDPCHGRRNIISVSRAGTRVAPALDALAEELAQDLERDLSDGEKEQLRVLLLKVIGNLAPNARSGDGPSDTPGPAESL